MKRILCTGDSHAWGQGVKGLLEEFTPAVVAGDLRLASFRTAGYVNRLRRRVEEKTGSFSREWSAGALAALFYAQKSQKLITEDGPKALALECVGADPAALLSAASQAALDELAFAPAASRYDGDPEDLLLKTLAEKALGGKDQFSEAFTIPINLGQNVYDDLPARFMEYLKAFSYSDALDDLRSSAEKLPETAAKPIPRNGRMSGNGSGPYWYGEEDMFMDLGTYRKSEPFQARSNHIITYTMGIVKDGNTASYQADPSEFRQK